jgi:LysR family transcriptional activator of nhaA
MRELNYNHLLYFWAVAREGGLTRAAERLHLSQSALSVQIRKLEHQLGHKLLEREGKKLVLTEAGRIALNYAETVFKTGNELVSTLKGRPLSGRQVLRVGALTTLSRNFQLEFLRPLLGRGDVELIVRSGTLHDLLGQIEAHALDVVLSNTAAPRDGRSSLRSYVLKKQTVSIVGHPRPGRRKFKFPDDLAGALLLLPSLESDIRVAFDRLLENANVKPVILAEVDDMAMLRLLARESRAAALVPPIVVRDELDNGILVEYCQIPEVTETFYAIVQKRRFPNPLLANLLRTEREE